MAPIAMVRTATTTRSDGVKERREPHHKLAEVKVLVSKLGVASFSKTGLDGGRAMGLTSNEMLQVIASLTRVMFYKSMTSHCDENVWQDVYHAPTPNQKNAYIKVILKPNAPVIQFKEK